jgi:hypothetical protein
MTLEYDDLADVMHISFADPESVCTYIESASGAILRVELATGQIVGARILGFSRVMEQGCYDIPEMNDPNFRSEWIARHRQQPHK